MEVVITTAITQMETTLVPAMMATNLTVMDTHVMVARCIFSIAVHSSDYS